MRKSEDEQGTKYVKKLINIIIGAAVGLVFCILILMVLTFAVEAGTIAQSSMFKLAVLSCFIGAFIGSQITIKRNKSKALLMGLFAGIFMFVLLMLVGASFYDGFAITNGGGGLLISSVIGGTAGGIFGAREKKRRK